MNNFDVPKPQADEDLTHKEDKRKEVITVGDPLPPEYQEVLSKIPPEIPQAYKDKMTEAAYYFWSLESGKELFDQSGNYLKGKVDLMAEQIKTSGFVGMTYASFEYLGGIAPEEALPKWALDSKSKEKKINESEIEQKYEAYVHDVAYKTEREPNGVYAYYEKGIAPPEKKERITNNFKCYVEDSLVDPDQVFACLTELAKKNLHPDSSKLLEGNRLVLYWSHQPDQLSSQIRAVFDSMRVKMRGAAQDPVRVNVETNGSQKIEPITSNDGSLGESGANDFIWRGKPYKPGEFFHQYLRLVANTAKDPTEPYKIGYVLVDTRNYQGNQLYIEGLVKGIEVQEGLPVIASEGRVRLDKLNANDGIVSKWGRKKVEM